MWMSKNAHFYFQPSGHHGVPLNGTQVMLKELKQWFAIFHLCFYYWLAIAVTCIAIRDAILNKMFLVPTTTPFQLIIIVIEPTAGDCVSVESRSADCLVSKTSRN